MKMLPVKDCSKCHYFFPSSLWHAGYDDVVDECDHPMPGFQRGCPIKRSEINDRYEIPKWCPLPDGSGEQNAETLYRHKAHAECQRLLYAAEQSLDLAMAALAKVEYLDFGQVSTRRSRGGWIVLTADGYGLLADGKRVRRGIHDVEPDWRCSTFAEAWRRVMLVLNRAKEETA